MNIEILASLPVATIHGDTSGLPLQLDATWALLALFCVFPVLIGAVLAAISSHTSTKHPS